MSKQQLLAKYNINPEAWEDESITKLKKWIKWFKGVQE